MSKMTVFSIRILWPNFIPYFGWNSAIRLKIISYLRGGFRENPYRKSIKNVLRHIPTESSSTLSSPKDRGGLPKGRCEHCAKNDIAQDVFSLLDSSRCVFLARSLIGLSVRNFHFQVLLDMHAPAASITVKPIGTCISQMFTLTPPHSHQPQTCLWEKHSCWEWLRPDSKKHFGMNWMTTHSWALWMPLIPAMAQVRFPMDRRWGLRCRSYTISKKWDILKIMPAFKGMRPVIFLLIPAEYSGGRRLRPNVTIPWFSIFLIPGHPFRKKKKFRKNVPSDLSTMLLPWLTSTLTSSLSRTLAMPGLQRSSFHIAAPIAMSRGW